MVKFKARVWKTQGRDQDGKVQYQGPVWETNKSREG